MQIGILDLVDWQPGAISQAGRYQLTIDAAVLAEELGFDTFWVGEHHFSRYISPSPVVLLAAIAARTRRIRLGTGVALAAHHDPVRLAEDYAMLDVISGGRVDLVLGRGLFLQGYRGFNQPYTQSRARVEEAAAIVRGLWTSAPFSHDGRFRQLEQVELQPRPVQQPHPPIWVAGGRTPESVRFAAESGFNLALPQINGPVDLYAPVAEAYRARLRELGRPLAGARISAGAHLYVGESTDAAEATWQAPYLAYLRMVADELDPALYAGTELEEVARRSRQAADSPNIERMIRGNTICGAPGAVAERLCAMVDALGVDHLWGHVTTGGLAPAEVFRSLERFARDVMPVVRAHAG